MAKETYRSKNNRIVGKDIHYRDRTVHERKLGPYYQTTGTTTHKNGKSTYKKA